MELLKNEKEFACKIGDIISISTIDLENCGAITASQSKEILKEVAENTVREIQKERNKNYERINIIDKIAELINLAYGVHEIKNKYDDYIDNVIYFAVVTGINSIIDRINGKIKSDYDLNKIYNIIK